MALGNIHELLSRFADEWGFNESESVVVECLRQGWSVTDSLMHASTAADFLELALAQADTRGDNNLHPLFRGKYDPTITLKECEFWPIFSKAASLVQERLNDIDLSEIQRRQMNETRVRFERMREDGQHNFRCVKGLIRED